MGSCYTFFPSALTLRRIPGWSAHSIFVACLQTIAQREVAALLGINSGRGPKAKQSSKQNIIVQVCQTLPCADTCQTGDVHPTLSCCQLSVCVRVVRQL